MSLDATRLANAIAPDLESQIRTAILSGSAVPYPNLTAFCQAVASSIATKVVAEIAANAALSNAKFSGTYPVVTGNVTITNQAVTGGVA